MPSHNSEGTSKIQYTVESSGTPILVHIIIELNTMVACTADRIAMLQRAISARLDAVFECAHLF